MPLVQVVSGNRVLASDLNQFYNLLKGVAASGESVTLIYNATALIFQPSADPAAGTRVLDIKNNAGTHLASLDYNGVLELLATAAAPSGAVAGAVYFDSLLSALRFYDGTQWQDSGVNLVNYHSFRYEPLGAPGGVAPGLITNVGTGTTALETVTGRGVVLNTGVTNPSSTSVHVQLAQAASVTDTATVSRIRRIEIASALANSFASANGYLYFTTEAADTAPSATARHFGIKNLVGTITFTTADGTTEQTTDITAFVTAAQVDRFVITFDGTTARCYVNGTLRATHTTNVPIGATGTVVFRAFLNNNASVNNKSLHLFSAAAMIANS